MKSGFYCTPVCQLWILMPDGFWQFMTEKGDWLYTNLESEPTHWEYLGPL